MRPKNIFTITSLSKTPEAKIDIVIVGAQKSATTSLKHYIGEHPAILAHPQIEFAYFIDDKEYANGVNGMLNKYFKNKNNKNVTMLAAKSALLYVSETGMQRLRQYNPDCKIVLILRNPVERTYSSYLMDMINFNYTFPEIKKIASDNEDLRYKIFIDSGIYAKHLHNIYKHFPKEQVKILLYEDIQNNGVETCQQIYKWLGVDASFTPDVNKKYNATKRRKSHFYTRALRKVLTPNSMMRKVFNSVVPEHYNHKVGDMLRDLNKKDTTYEEMDPSTKKFLLDFFRPHNKELAEMIGRDLSAWDK